MENGYYRLEHTYYSRGGNKYHGPSGNFHLARVQNYDANYNKAEHIKSVNLPDDRFDLYGKMIGHSNTVRRKNGRMAERIILCHDKRMSAAARRESTIAFLDRVTFGGKIKGYAYHHNQDTHNPHAHIVLLDVGKNGKPVGHFGRNATFRRQNSPVKGNPTIWFRVAWEQECNAVLERHGYDFRIDHRSNLERDLAAPEKHRGWQQSLSPELSENLDGTGELKELPELQTEEVLQDEVQSEPINEPQSADVPLAPEVDNDDAPVEECTMSTLEKDYLEKLSPEERELLHKDFIARDEYQSPAQRITDALEYDLEFQAIQKVKDEIALLDARAKSARELEAKFRETAREVGREVVAHEMALSVAQEELAPLTKANGKLRGFELFGFKSPTRKRAVEAEQRVNRHEWTMNVLQADKDDLTHKAEVSQAESQRDSLRSQAKELQLLNEIRETYGNDKTLKDAEYIHARSVSEALAPVTAADIYATFEIGEITAEQAIRACELTGDLEMITAIEQRQAIEEEMDPTGAYEQQIEL